MGPLRRIEAVVKGRRLGGWAMESGDVDVEAVDDGVVHVVGDGVVVAGVVV